MSVALLKPNVEFLELQTRCQLFLLLEKTDWTKHTWYEINLFAMRHAFCTKVQDGVPSNITRIHCCMSLSNLD